MTRSANSFPENRAHLLEKSRELLGWPLIQEALSGYACSPVTSELCRSLVPHSDIGSANNALNTTASMVEYLTGKTYELKQKRRNELLSTRLEDIKSFAVLFRKIKESGSVCVLGNEEKIKKSKNRFDHLIKVFE